MNLGPMEILVIFVVALLVFGPKKLPELGKSLGKGLSEFRRASAELRGSLEREMENIEHEVKIHETQAASPAPPPAPVQTASVTRDSHPGFVRADADSNDLQNSDLHSGLHPDGVPSYPEEYQR
jgi:sec-independent protein translocase protein TatA